MANTKIINGSPEERRCPQCGAILPSHVAPEQCPKCLLQAGLAGTTGSTEGEASSPGAGHASAGLPKPGDEFGHYRINRVLGRGGMGAVFDADDMANGRRVALKVISQTLDVPEARARFLREGRLAAAINHPNSVYVFGTEEIAGTPVIAMELVAGGTLQDRVQGQGPMPVGEAVDAILQVIAGLEAAQAVGVLHRDVKPSNCFVDLNGRVKIGDFGLSISTAPRLHPMLTATGQVVGTPAFSSPEQLRGDELTVRSDIYAVGVTLYYLLTGKLPFQASNLVQMVATVLERSAESPARWRQGLPAGLCRAVLRCLEKVPGERFRNYSDLRSALIPYASFIPQPAPLPRRFLAGAIDGFVLGLPQFLAIFLLTGAKGFAMDEFRQPWFLYIFLQGLVLGLSYYAILEGHWGAALGKRICGLRLRREGRDNPGLGRALLRAWVYLLPPLLPTLLLWVLSQGMDSQPGHVQMTLFQIAPMVLMALLFVTARERNGLAGVHDLASGTRVVLAPSHIARPGLPSAAEESQPAQTAESTKRAGPYHILGPLGSLEPDGGQWLAGFDPQLLRRVWIHKLPPGSPPVSPALRSLGRPGRVRWLTGFRSETEAWDVYEALSGMPLVNLQPQEWARARFWLLDLAEELDAAARDHSTPRVLTVDRVWITAEGRARLLDFPAPGAPAGIEQSALGEPNAGLNPVPEGPAAFLQQVARQATGDPGKDSNRSRKARWPLPLHALTLIERLGTAMDWSEVLQDLKAQIRKPASITPARRLVWLLGESAFFVLFAGMMALGLIMVGRFVTATPGAAPLIECLGQLDRLRFQKGAEVQVRRKALEVYVAGRFRPFITNRVTWGALPIASSIPRQQRTMAEQVVAAHPSVSEEELSVATAEVNKIFKGTPDAAAARTRDQLKPIPLALGLAWLYTVVFVVLPCLLAALIFRSGLVMHTIGIALVNAKGERASRWRITWRNLAGWLPFLIGPTIVLTVMNGLGPVAASLLITTAVGILAVVSSVMLKRSIQDRLAGTYLVPK